MADPFTPERAAEVAAAVAGEYSDPNGGADPDRSLPDMIRYVAPEYSDMDRAGRTASVQAVYAVLNPGGTYPYPVR